MVVLKGMPSLMYSSTARNLSLYEYINYPLGVQDFIRMPGGPPQPHKDTDSPQAQEAPRRIRELYAIEKTVCGRPPDEQCRVRQEQALPRMLGMEPKGEELS